MFLPITQEEALQRGWAELDVIFVSGDAYIDHPAFGVPLLARLLESRGFRVGIIPQPDWRSCEPFRVLGRPRLFFAVSAGAMDSMVAHYTPARKLRHDDAYSPGNRHGARPNRATIVYTSRLKEAYPGVSVVLGGIEASLRRFAHYDYWEDKVRRSVLLDSKADMLVFGMGESPLLEVAEKMKEGMELHEIRHVRGTAFVSSSKDADGVELPSFEEVAASTEKYAEAFRIAAREANPFCARPLLQRHGKRLVRCNPPALPLAVRELDALYALPFRRAPHPSYVEPIPAYEQIRTSITSHRGCFGGCAFCAITHHQGKVIQSRTESSILSELESLSFEPWFKGSVSDIGGPTANMYGAECGSPVLRGKCRKQSCLFPAVCPHLNPADHRLADVLRRATKVRGVKNVAVSSGIRYDLLVRQPEYMKQLLSSHVGGYLKVAPEHLADRVTRLMRKPGKKCFVDFLEAFKRESRRAGKKQFVIPYLISGHPGCTMEDMVELALSLKRMGLQVEQVQDFTPTPGTLSTCMYYTGIDPETSEEVHVPRTDREKMLQKSLLLYHVPGERRKVLQALDLCGRSDAGSELLGHFSLDRKPVKKNIDRGKNR